MTLSPLAQLLEATIAFQQQQVGAAETATTGSFDADFTSLATTTQLFINAFNNFQTSTTNDAGSEFDTALNNALLMTLQPQGAQGSGATRPTFIDSLAALGINFQISAGGADQFQVSWTALEAAFNTYPAQTSALIANAFQAISDIEKNLVLLPPADQPYMYATDFARPADLTAQSPAAQGTSGAMANADPMPTGALPAAQNPALLATAATDAASATLNTGAASTVAATVAPLVAGPDQNDPFVVAAIAAYRVNEVIVDNETDNQPDPVAEVVPDVSTVTNTDVVNEATHDQTDSNGRNRLLGALHQRTTK